MIINPFVFAQKPTAFFAQTHTYIHTFTRESHFKKFFPPFFPPPPVSPNVLCPLSRKECTISAYEMLPKRIPKNWPTLFLPSVRPLNTNANNRRLIRD